MGIIPLCTVGFRTEYIQIQRETDFAAAIYADTGRILVECRQIAAKSRKGASHAHEAGCASQFGLRQIVCIHRALCRKCQWQYGQCAES